MIYLDYSASTPVDKEVLDLFYNTNLKFYSNPNSNHKLGLQEKKLINEASENILNLLNIKDSEVIYTSGSTESNNLAIKGIAERYKVFGKHILISTLEHNSIISSCTHLQEQGYEIELIPVLKNGLIDIDSLKNMIRKDTILVSITAVDSEVGLKQPIEEIGNILVDYPNITFHTDSTQAIGKVSIDYSNVDLITFAPHKFYGLNGIGVLIRKNNKELRPIIDGGKSTTMYRSGTPDFANIIALNKALELAILNLDNRYNYVLGLNNMVIPKLKKHKNIHINNTKNSIPFTINFSVDKIKSNDLVKKLEDMDIIVSAKTSCCPVETPSKLILALTHNKNLSYTSVRVSLSHLTTNKEINIFLDSLEKIIKECI